MSRPDPEHFVTGAFVKIGYFRTNVDLLYHDEIHGDLFTQGSGGSRQEKPQCSLCSGIGFTSDTCVPNLGPARLYVTET